MNATRGKWRSYMWGKNFLVWLTSSFLLYSGLICIAFGLFYAVSGAVLWNDLTMSGQPGTTNFVWAGICLVPGFLLLFGRELLLKKSNASSHG